MIKEVIECKYRHLIKSNYPNNHKIIISKLQSNCWDSNKLKRYDLENILLFWDSKLFNHKSFITIVFICLSY